MCGVGPISVCFQRATCGSERAHGAAEFARDERDLRCGDRAPRTRHWLVRAESAFCIAQQLPGPPEVAELRHGNTAQREGDRVITQRDSLQRGERITRRQRAGRVRDQRFHENPVTFVTHAGFMRCPTFSLDAIAAGIASNPTTEGDRS